MTRYVQCLVCGRMTPADKGVCYHCKSPLPSRVDLPEGMVVCPSCLRVTPASGGYCRHCKSPLPPSLVDAAERSVRRYEVLYRGRRPTAGARNVDVVDTPYYSPEGIPGLPPPPLEVPEEPASSTLPLRPPRVIVIRPRGGD